jgi:hypothetical protein
VLDELAAPCEPCALELLEFWSAGGVLMLFEDPEPAAVVAVV